MAGAQSDRARRERGKELAPEARSQRFALTRVQARPRPQPVPPVGQARQAFRDTALLAAKEFPDPIPLGVLAVAHIELVQVRTEDREVAETLQQGGPIVLRRGQHPPVELDEALLRVKRAAIVVRRACRLGGSRYPRLGRRPLRHQRRAGGDGERCQGTGILQPRGPHRVRHLTQQHPIDPGTAVGLLAAAKLARQPHLQGGLLDAGWRASQQDEVRHPAAEPLAEAVPHGLLARSGRHR